MTEDGAVADLEDADAPDRNLVAGRRKSERLALAGAPERAATACAVAVQQVLAAPAGTTGSRPRCASASTPPATHLDGDYQGRGVHQAARIGGAASAGEILVSRSTLSEVERFPYSPPRTIALKGFAEPVLVVAVKWREGSNPSGYDAPS